jgi:hypothetical protein
MYIYILQMSINYNNIKDLVSLMYKYVYDKDTTILTDYNYEKLDWENIKIDDLIGTNFNYQYILNSNYEKKDNFKIINIFDDDKYKKIILKKYFKEFPLTIVVQKYLTNNEPININDITYELFMNQIISEFVIYDKVPFFLLNICNFNSNLQKLSNYSDFNTLLTKEFNLLDSTDSESIFCFSIYEHYHSYITFNELLSEELSNDDIKIIFFQLFFTYAYLITKLDSFYHGNYTLDSFLIMKNTSEYPNIKLNLGDTIFELKKPKYICKLFNYRKSQIYGFKNYSDKDIVINNPTYSIYCILKSMYDTSLKLNKKNFEKIKIIISNFIPINLIERTKLDENNFYNIYSDTIIPLQILLKNNFFAIFINMNFKNNIIENKKNIDILNMDSIKSDTIETESEGLVGYRTIKSNVLEGGANKSSKKASKKSSKKTKASKSSKKPSKKAAKYLKQSRQEILSSDVSSDNNENEYEETENIDSYSDEDEKLELETETENDSSEEPVKQPTHLSVEEEDENISLNTEGDDDNNTTPLDSEEMGKNYKNIIKNLMKENKELKKKKKLSKSSKSSKSKKYSKDDSSSLNLDLDDLDNENGSKNNMEGINNLNGINSIPNMGMTNMNYPNGNASMTNVMLPDKSFLNNSSMIKMKQGNNNNFNQIFNDISKEGMIPVIPEMLHNFDLEQIKNMPQKEFSSDVGGLMNGGPKIMDQGLLNQGMGNFGDMGGLAGIPGMGGMGGMGGFGGMKKSLPLVSDPNLASMAGINQYGNTLSGLNHLGSAMSGEFGNGDKVPVPEPVQPTNPVQQNILEGGLGSKYDITLSENTSSKYNNLKKIQMGRGTKTSFNLNEIQSSGIFEVPPEMQQYFDLEQMKKQLSESNIQEGGKKKNIFFLTKK